MPRRARPLDPERNLVHRFALELREVHRRAGKPTRVWLGSKMNCSHATVSHLLNGDRFPSWQQASALIAACGDDPERFRDLWLEIDAALETEQYVPKTYRLFFERQMVMPIYLVCDVSKSIGQGRIDALNHALAQLVERFQVDPLVADLTRFCLIAFSNDAEVLLPLVNLSVVENVPAMTSRSAARYAPAFDLLRKVIERDMLKLKAEHYDVYRPVVFFITGSHPTDFDRWEPAHRALTDPSWRFHPNILAFGLGDVSGVLVGRIATFKAFIVTEMASSLAALQEFVASMFQSIVSAAPHSTRDASIKAILFNELDGVTELEDPQVATSDDPWL